jgi:hypothetical protein
MVEKDGKCWSPTHGKVVQCFYRVILEVEAGSWKKKKYGYPGTHVQTSTTGTGYGTRVDTRKNIPKRTNM